MFMFMLSFTCFILKSPHRARANIEISRQELINLTYPSLPIRVPIIPQIPRITHSIRIQALPIQLLPFPLYDRYYAYIRDN